MKCGGSLYLEKGEKSSWLDGLLSVSRDRRLIDGLSELRDVIGLECKLMLYNKAL